MSKKILVVDDDEAISSIFDFILQQAGYTVETAPDGYACLEILRQKKNFDLIFLDVKMPGLSGLDTLTKIQKIRPDLLVMMMTGYSVDNLVKMAFELGAYGVVYKPFDVEEVLSIIKKIFQARREHEN